MRLIELDPRWILRDGERIGFTFRSPTDTKFRQSCFVEPVPMREQMALFEIAFDEDGLIQTCKPTFAWTISGGIEDADFATVSVTPSLDGSAGGLWHGHITNGEIVGGL